MTAIPEPTSLERSDGETHTVNLCVLVAGAAARSYLDAVRAASEAAAGLAPGQLVEDGDPAQSYLVVDLGEIRGWTTRVHLYGFGTDARLVPILQRYASRADGIVVAEPPNAGPPGEVTRGLASAVALGGRDTPVAIYADETLARHWGALTDKSPIHVTEAQDAQANPTLRAVLKVMLTQLRRPSERPPSA